MIRLFDLMASFFGLLIFTPVISLFCFLIWKEDRHSPFYIAPRVGADGKPFNMVKLRSMTVDADKSGVDSTSSNDPRISSVGQIVRAYKLDELTQLWNVFRGDMSLVGPRPNVQRDVDLYTELERKLLTVKPGITDISSIVFSDEGEILKDSKDPDLDYNRLIRPWKSRLGLLYVENRSIILNISLIFWTVIALFSKKSALQGLQGILTRFDADKELIRAASREDNLKPFPPPGSDSIVLSRK